MFKKDSFTEHDNKTCFIFEEDYNILLSKTTQEEHGNLFGLWTTDGEPVIHVVCVPNCCPIKLHSRHLGNDILGKDLPLSHIGDWSYPSSTVTSESRRSDRLGCSHQSKGKFLDVLVSNSTLLVLERDSKKRQVNILSDRSPFKNLKDFKTMVIKGQQDEKDIDTLRERMKYLSIANRDSVERNEVSSSPDAGPLHLGIKKQLEFGANRHDFKVFMFEEDYRMIESLVLRYPNLETGGDLFGLWTTEGNAVLHVVLGPGQDCKRTGASFYQDISYLKENGELLTQDYMLCHIGEWHSHHQLQLFKPSGGDSSTVIRNYPRGVCGFLLVIANILSSHQVKLSAYLYTESSSYSFDKEGTIIRLGLAPNAFKNIPKIRDRAERGKERYSISEYPRDSYHEFRRYSTQTKPYARDRRSPTLFYKGNPKPYDVQIPKPMSYSTRQLVSSPLRRNGRKSASSNTRLENRPPWR